MPHLPWAPQRVPLLALLICLAVISPAAASSTDNLQQLRHTVQQQPSNPVHHIQLAVALHELNHQAPDGGSRVPEAEDEYRTALSLISPKGQHAAIYAHVQGNLGALLLSADRPTEAITEFEGALKLGQQLQQQLQQQIKQHRKNKKKYKQQQQQHASAALAELQQELTDVQQQLAGATFNLGKALTSIGRLAEADELYAQAAAAANGSDFGSYGKALAAMGRIQQETAAQALHVCQEATRHFAKQPQLSFLSDIPPPPAPTSDDSSASDAPVTAAADSANKDATQLDKASLWISNAQSVDLVWLYFALYKHYHHAKQTALAWYYLQLGNRIMVAHVHYDLAKEQRNLGHIRSLFRAPFTTSRLQDRTAVFVVGMPRSGSTLVEQMLASHPQVFAAGEDTALAPLTTDINRLLAGSSPADRPAILDHFAERYLATMRAKVPRAWLSQKQDAAADGMAETADDASGAATPARIVDKMLRNLWLVGYIHMLLPNSCIIHVVRHPMDVALSCYTQPFGYSGSAMAWSWDLADIATQIKMTWEVAEHWEQHLPGRVNTVFYEELVERPEAVAAQLLSACGLDWDHAVLNFHTTKRSVQTASMAQVRQPLYKTAVQRWKVYEQQLEPLREKLAPLIARYEQMLLQRMSAPAAAAGVAHSPDQEAGQNQSPGSSDSVRDEL